MAIVNGPLFSLDASGQVGKAIVYTKWKGRNVVREYVTPANPASIAQRARRTMVSLLNLFWSVMDSTDRDSWNAGASSLEISPFNYFTGQNLDRQTADQLPTKNLSDTPTTPTSVMDTISGTGGSGRIDVTLNFTDPTAGEYWVVSLAEGTSAATKSIQNIVKSGVQDGSASQLTSITGLTPGTYSIAAWVLSNDGDTQTGQSTATSIVVTG